MQGIYIWHFPDGTGYIGQAQDIETRIEQEAKGAFNVKNHSEYRRRLGNYIRSHGLKGVTFSFYPAEQNFGIDQNLLLTFQNTLLDSSNNPISPIDAAEILHILKSIDSNQSELCSLNDQMGGQYGIYNIKQSNGIILKNMLQKSTTPLEAYQLLSMSDVRQENITKYIELFKDVVFTTKWDDFLSFAKNLKPDLIITPNLQLNWPDFVSNKIINTFSIWTTIPNGTKSIQEELSLWIQEKMGCLFQFLPQYLNQFYHQNNKAFNNDAYRDFKWAGNNLYKAITNADSELSKSIRHRLHIEIGRYLTAGKYIYTQKEAKWGLTKFIFNEMGKRIKEHKEDLSKALTEELTNVLKEYLSTTLLKAIRLSNNKLKPDSTWWNLFQQWKRTLTQESHDDWLKEWTYETFALLMSRVHLYNPVNLVDKQAYTTYYPDENKTKTEHSRHYKKDNNAIRMNFIDTEDELYWRVREQYKDTKFYHSWFEFYRPLITRWRLEKTHHIFIPIEVEHEFEDNSSEHRSWIGYQQDFWILYRSQHILLEPEEITIY